MAPADQHDMPDVREPGAAAPASAPRAAPAPLPTSPATPDPAVGRRLPPPGILLFLGYGFLVLGGIGLSLRWVVDQAISAPVSLPGIVAMVLLAYTIFTITMVLQRKEAARGLALGLSTLTIPAVPLLLLSPVQAVAVVPAILGVALFVGLRRPSARAWLAEP
jgi:hypothetical protein